MGKKKSNAVNFQCAWLFSNQEDDGFATTSFDCFIYFIPRKGAGIFRQDKYIVINAMKNALQ